MTLTHSHFSLFLLLASSICTSICMESTHSQSPLLTTSLQYNSIGRPENRHRTFMPRTLNEYHDFLHTQNITVIRPESPCDRFDTCFTVAITEILGITGKAPQHLKIGSAADLITQCHVIDKYYQQIPSPIPNCLVVFTNNNNVILHFALTTQLAENNDPAYCMVKSKWGLYHSIIEHEIFDIPQEYGDTATFFALKDEFEADKASMLQQIKVDIAQSVEIKKYIYISQTMLLKLANGKDLTDVASHFLKQKINLYEKAWYMLQVCMGLNINTRNQKNETILMLATKRNDINMIQVFLNMGANKALCDKDGNTALSIAQQFSYYRAIELLQ